MAKDKIEMGEDTAEATVMGTTGANTLEGASGQDTLTGVSGEDMITAADTSTDFEHVVEGLADHPDDVIERAEVALAAADPFVAPAPEKPHGSHDAAMRGQQTDASGTYTPPVR